MEHGLGFVREAKNATGFHKSGFILRMASDPCLFSDNEPLFDILYRTNANVDCVRQSERSLVNTKPRNSRFESFCEDSTSMFSGNAPRSKVIEKLLFQNSLVR